MDAAFRCESYRLLALSYYPPGEELAETIKQLEAMTGWKLPDGERALAADNSGQLKIDHARLFLGPYELLAPPYGSVYLENKRIIMGDSTMDVKKRYQKEGLSIVLKEAPDHISVELEFMYYLACREIEMLQLGEYASALKYREKQLDFLEKHLASWISRFTKNAQENARTGFYKYLAAFTDEFIQDDLQFLKTSGTFLPVQSDLAG